VHVPPRRHWTKRNLPGLRCRAYEEKNRHSCEITNELSNACIHTNRGVHADSSVVTSEGCISFVLTAVGILTK
jgi:hypothetical protein